MFQNRKRVFICTKGPNCCQLSPRPQLVLEALRQAVLDQKVADSIEIIDTGCIGMCGYGPNARIKEGRSSVTSYSGLEPGDAPEIIAAHVNGDRPVERKRFKVKTGET
jgi:(2Fe-2S) ferredoxin